MRKRIISAGIIAGLAVAIAATIMSTSHSKAAASKTVEGTFTDKKDFMFTVEAEDGNAYGLAFEKAPEGYETLKDGDRVIVEYSGDINEADSFTGTIESVKKVNEKVGIFTDKKDFMFTLEDIDGGDFGFFFGNGNAPEGYDSLNAEDMVLVRYTGEINEVDAFTGEVLSVTKL